MISIGATTLGFVAELIRRLRYPEPPHISRRYLLHDVNISLFLRLTPVYQSADRVL